MLMTLTLTFIVLLLAGMPLGFCLGLAAMFGMILEDIPLFLITRKMYAGLDVFVLLAVPLFILAAEIMTASGITLRLIRFADLLVGRIRGGLAHTNVLGSMFFAGISGTAIADASGLGSVEIQMMEAAGYEKDFSAGVTAASAIIGPIIPPSVIMVIYAVIAGDASVIGLFTAGIVPGIALGVGLMAYIYYVSTTQNLPKRTEKIPLREALKIVQDGMVAIFMPFIILGGILAGVFTPTEAAAVAAFYAFIVGMLVTRELKLKVLPELIVRTMVTTSVIFFIIAAATIVSYLLSVAKAPDAVAGAIAAVSTSKFVFLLLANVFFLFMGCIMEPGAAIIISVPVFAPVAHTFGVDPLHFGIIVVLNLTIGCITPPVGTSLYAVAAVAKLPVEKVVRATAPFLLVEIGVLFLVTYVPSLTLTLPKLLGVYQ